jgi:hypothetical protein
MQANKTIDTGFVGNVRKDNFGRIVVDSCESDVDHHLNSVAKPGDDRARCRRLVEEAFAGYVGRRGKMVIAITFEDEVVDGALPSDVFTAVTRKHSIETPGQIVDAVIAALEHIDGD